MLKVYTLLFIVCFFCNSSFSAIDNDDHQFTVVKEGSKKGLFDEDGKVIIPVIYEDLGWSKGTTGVYCKAIGYREHGLWGLIGIKNKKITTPLFNNLQPFCDKLLIASRKNKSATYFGLINTKGEQELEFRYYSLEKNNEQLIAAVLEKNFPVYGVINQKGKALIGFEYSNIVPLSAETYAVYDHSQHVALFDTEGVSLTSFGYDSITPFRNHLAVVYKDGKQGVIREDGTIAVPLNYKKVSIDDLGQVSVLPFGKWHVLTAENEPVRTYTFESIIPAGKNLYQVAIGDIQTFVDAEGKPLLPEQWRVTSLQDQFAIIAHGNKYGVLSSKADTNRVILQPEYDSLTIDGNFILACKKTPAGESAWSLFDDAGKKLTYYVYQSLKKSSESYFLAKRRDYWGYVDQQGGEAIACQYLAAEPFKHQRAQVSFIDGQGVIDEHGNWIIKPFKYNGAPLQLERIHDRLFIFHTKPHHYAAARYGLIDNEGNEIFVSDAMLTDNGSSVWEINEQGKYGLISYEGERLLDTKYDTISALQENAAYIFTKEGGSGILSKDGKVLVDLENPFQELHDMSENYFGVKIDDKFGFVDTLGRLRIANRYDSITHFKSGMAAVSLLGRWGYIDKTERLVVQPQFERAYPFSGGLAVVKKDGKYGMVDKKGETVVSIEYDRIYPGQKDRFLVARAVNDGYQVGLVSKTGRALIYPKYDTLEDLGNGFVIITRKEKYGLLTVEGRSTIPLIYDDLLYDAYNNVYLALKSTGWQQINLTTIDAKK